MGDPANTVRNQILLNRFLASQPWTDDERLDVLAFVLAAGVMATQGFATKTVTMSATVNGIRADLTVTVDATPPKALLN